MRLMILVFAVMHVVSNVSSKLDMNQAEGVRDQLPLTTKQLDDMTNLQTCRFQKMSMVIYLLTEPLPLTFQNKEPYSIAF